MWVGAGGGKCKQIAVQAPGEVLSGHPLLLLITVYHYLPGPAAQQMGLQLGQNLKTLTLT